MMAAEGGLFPRGRGGAGLGPAKGSVFGGLHVLLCHSSLAHRKSAEGVSSSLEVVILWWPGGRVGVFRLEDSSARCAMSV